MTTEAASPPNDAASTTPAPAPMPPPDDPWVQFLQWLFAYDVLHIRQKLLAISEKYYVTDDAGQPRFYVVRPPHLMLNIVLGLAITALRVGILLIAIFGIFLRTGDIITAIAVIFVGNIGLGIAAVLMAPYRDIAVYTDDSLSWRLLTITQDNKIGLHRRYTLYDCFGSEVARLRRSTLWSLVRVVWNVETPDGRPLMRAREDSLVRALLRRYLGPLYGVLRTNFNFEYPSGAMFGKYDRKLTLTDQYTLDLRGDPGHLVDRRVTLAMSILLDTGESR